MGYHYFDEVIRSLISIEHREVCPGRCAEQGKGDRLSERVAKISQGEGDVVELFGESWAFVSS